MDPKQHGFYILTCIHGNNSGRTQNIKLEIGKLIHMIMPDLTVVKY